MNYRIVNLVALANINHTLNLYDLAAGMNEVEYEPEQFPGAVLKLRKPKVSLLLFRNGKIIVSGAKNEKEILTGIKNALKLVHKIQPEVKIRRKTDYEIVNMVASARLNKNLDLFELALELDNVEYEPEQFPGAIMKLADPKSSFLLFLNGQMICAGVKNEGDLRKALNKTRRLVDGALKKQKVNEQINGKGDKS